MWSKVRAAAQSAGEWVKGAALAVVGLVGGAVALTAQEAHAALPTGVDTALGAVQTDAASLMDIVAPVLIAILGMTIVLKLIKRFANKV